MPMLGRNAQYWKAVATERQRRLDATRREMRRLHEDAERDVRFDVAQMMDALALTAKSDKTWEEVYKEARRRVMS